MRTFANRALFILLATAGLTSCKTYTMVHYKSTELDKVGKISKYTVYIHDKSNTYKVDKPVITPVGIKDAQLVKITDPETITEIKNPSTPALVKKHRHDLSLYTKVLVNDSNEVVLKKTEINDITHTTFTSTGPAIANTVATIIVSGLCVGLLYGVYMAFKH